MSPGNVVAQQGRRLVHVHHQYVHVAIIVEIAEGTAATRVRRADPAARLLNQFLKPPVAQIAENQPGCLEGIGRQLLPDLGINAPGSDKQVGNEIIIEMKDSRSPPYISRLHTYARPSILVED